MLFTRARLELGTVVALVVLVVAMVWLNHLSQSRLRNDAIEQFRNQAATEASAFHHFFSERANDLADLAGHRELPAYFDNQALGMSREYGLWASLVNMSELFGRFVAQKRLNGVPVYGRLALYDEHGDLLADDRGVGDGAPLPPELAPVGPGPEYVVLEGDPGAPPLLLLVAPYEHRGRMRGLLVARINTDEAFPALRGRSMAPGNGRTLLALDDALFPLAGPLPVAVAKDAAQGAAPPPGKAAERRLEAGGTMVDFLLVSIPVEPTRFRLMSYVPARDVTGPLSPGGLLLSTLLLCAVITGGGALLLVSRHRNLAQQEEHREFVRTIFEGIGAAIFVFDPREGLMTDCNATAERLLSMPRERLVGRRDAPEIALAGKRRRNLLQPDEKDSGIYEEGKLHLPERTVPVSWRLFGVHIGGKGRLVQVVFDITERRDLERRLNVAQKLESIGLLASGIAHEINTPIQYIGDSVRFAEDAFRDLDGLFSLQERRLRLLARGEDDPALAEEAERRREDADLDFLRKETPRACSRALEGVDRVASIVSAMRNFSHPGADAKAPVDINHAVRTTVTVARNEWKYVAEMELNLAPDLPLVMALAGGVNQVLLNIIVNAAHAIGELGPQADGGHGKGVITITTAREADMVAVTIRDTGRGIPEENLHKVFDPFFTTKAVGKGTGQGLAIVHDIVVDKHGGTIDVDSAPGRGTAFTLRLPIEGTEDDRSRA